MGFFDVCNCVICSTIIKKFFESDEGKRVKKSIIEVGKMNEKIYKEQKMSNEKLENEPEMISVNLPLDVMRLQGKPLQATAVSEMDRVKKMGNDFHAYLENFPKTREMSLAKTKLEECVMWAVKGISS